MPEYKIWCIYCNEYILVEDVWVTPSRDIEIKIDHICAGYVHPDKHGKEKEDAWDDGHDEGYDEGYEDGKEKGIKIGKGEEEDDD